MLYSSKNQAIAAALQSYASVLERPAQTFPMADYFQAELRRISLSDAMDEQLLILDEAKGSWVDEGVTVSALDSLRALTQDQGYLPSENQQERLRSHGFKASKSAILAKDVRRFARNR